MNLDDAQRKKVTEWIAQGLKLSELQNRLASELGLHVTYMDVRLLVDDLKLTPKDVERPKSPARRKNSQRSAASGSRRARLRIVPGVMRASCRRSDVRVSSSQGVNPPWPP